LINIYKGKEAVVEEDSGFHRSDLLVGLGLLSVSPLLVLVLILKFNKK